MFCQLLASPLLLSSLVTCSESSHIKMGPFLGQYNRVLKIKHPATLRDLAAFWCPTPNFQMRISDCLDDDFREKGTFNVEAAVATSCFPFLWVREKVGLRVLCNPCCLEFNPPALTPPPPRVLGLQVCATVSDLRITSQFSIGSRSRNTKEQKPLRGVWKFYGRLVSPQSLMWRLITT